MYGFQREQKYYENERQSKLENEEGKTLWDFNIQCDHLVVEKERKECKITDIVVVLNDERVGEIGSKKR